MEIAAPEWTTAKELLQELAGMLTPDSSEIGGKTATIPFKERVFVPSFQKNTPFSYSVRDLTSIQARLELLLQKSPGEEAVQENQTDPIDKETVFSRHAHFKRNCSPNRSDQPPIQIWERESKDPLQKEISFKESTKPESEAKTIEKKLIEGVRGAIRFLVDEGRERKESVRMVGDEKRLFRETGAFNAKPAAAQMKEVLRPLSRLIDDLIDAVERGETPDSSDGRSAPHSEKSTRHVEKKGAKDIEFPQHEPREKGPVLKPMFYRAEPRLTLPGAPFQNQPAKAAQEKRKKKKKDLWEREEEEEES